MFVMMLLLLLVYTVDIPVNNAQCIDIHHHMVSQGLHYVPGPNPCTLCICDKGSPKWCKQVLCSPPQNCKSFQVGNSCCEFKCLDDILSKSDNYGETYDLALRLIASAVTAVLSLSLLFFLIHRLRQRKIRLRQNRQLSEDQRSLNSIGYITGSLGYLPGSIGYLGTGSNELEYHYDESNVHYPLWKPPGNYFPRGEAPPPYEEAVRAARAEAELVSNHNQMNSNVAPFIFSSNRNENVSLTLVHNTHVSITPNVQQSAQCNVMLHQSNNVQSIQPPDTRNEPGVIAELQPQNPIAANSTSVSLACGSGVANRDLIIDSSSNFLPNATLESQVDVHYENYNNNHHHHHHHHQNHQNVANTAPVVTVSVKNDESFSKQALDVDYLRDKVDKSTYAVADSAKAITAGSSSDANNHYLKNDLNTLSNSTSWRRESHNAGSSSKPNISGNHEQKLKYLEKKQRQKNDDYVSNSNSCSSSKRSDHPVVDCKTKKCNVIPKESSRLGKSVAGKLQDKPKTQTKSQSNEKQIDSIISESAKHRTIPQKFAKNVAALEMCYVNATDLGKRAQIEDEFSEHCDNIPKQHDKLRYTAEKIDKKHSEKIINANNNRNSMCSSSDSRSGQRTTSNSNSNISLGMLKGSVSSHRTLPKNLREISEAFYFNFNNAMCEETSLDSYMKKTLPRSNGVQNEIPAPSASVEKQLKALEASCMSSCSNTGSLSRKAQDKKPTHSSSSMSSSSALSIPSCYRSQIDPIKTEISNSSNNDLDPIVDTDRNCITYHCISPTQDDVDDYRSECENCKSLSFEDCNDEEGDLLNETMTLQRRPMEQGDEHTFYRTSLTLPSHTKKTNTRSVNLNAPRESWFMAMQEMTSSSESD